MKLAARTTLFLAAIVGFTLIAFVASTFAQNDQCSNRPAGDNSNACANTRYVKTAIPITPTGTPSAGQIIVATSPTTAQWQAGSTWFDTAYCNTVGYIIVRFTSAWACAASIPINIVWMGADPLGVVDASTIIQAAITTAEVSGGSVYIPSGSFAVATGLTITNPNAGSGVGKRINMFGDSMGTSVLLSTASAPTITINGGGGNSDQQRVRYHDFAIIRPGAPRTGTGIRITDTGGIGYLTFEQISISGFSVGLDSINGLSVWVLQSIIDHNTIGIRAVQSGIGSYPNAWAIRDTVMSANTSFAISFANAASLIVENLDCESNGTMAQVSGCIHMNGNPVNGSQGLVSTGGYYQGNKGTADIYINDGGGTDGTHTIIGGEFARIDPVNFVTNHILVEKSVASQVNVNTYSNSFKSFNGYAPSAGRRDIAYGTVSDNNFRISTCYNSYFDAASAPVLDGQQTVQCGGKTIWGSDSNIGLGPGTAFVLNIANATEGKASGIASVGGTFRNLFAKVVTAPGGAETYTLTWRVNGSDTTITCTITGAATACNDTGHTAAVSASQTFSLKVVGSGAAAATNLIYGIGHDNP